MSTLRLSSQSWHGLLNRISVISTASTPPEYHVTDPAAPSEYDDSRSVASLPRYSVIEPFETYVDSEVAPSTPTMPSLPRRAEEISDRRRDTPAFGGGDAQTQHTFNIEGDNKAKPWAVLKLYSSASSSSASPQIYGNGEVSGSVNLNLDSPQTVSLIEIILRGRIIKGNLQEETFKFLEHTLPVWSKASGHPHQPTTGPSHGFDGRLSGDFVWPFSFPFPSEIRLSRGNNPTSPRYFYNPPQTFVERDALVNVRYELTVRIHRGRLRSVSRIRTPIVYTPKIIPDVPSPLRQQAYRDALPLPGPKVDAIGWFNAPTATVRGTFAKRQPVEIKCTLSLANPLCYTRGTVIPCSLMLESSDHQLLDTLGKPKRIDLRLVRQLKYYKEPSLVLTRVGHSQEPLIDSSTVTSAVWWVPPKDGLHGSHERRLEGEIHLPPNLQPSSNFLLFSVEYTVVLYPFLSSSFVPAASGHESLIKQVVKVATFRCEGPEPRSFTQARAVKSLELGDTGKSKQTDPLQGAPDVSWFGPTPMSPWG